jgi:C4-dicarboxylate-specific signal transduction histidine kinase
MEHLARLNTMGEMAAGLAHELNQPLASILTYAGSSLNSIMSDNASFERIAPALQEVVNETRRASEIIRRLRSFIRKRDPHQEPTNVNMLILDAWHMMKHDLTHAEITPHLKLGHELPMALVDSVQIVQVLVNLIRNARDAMLEPGAKGRDLTITSSNFEDGIQVDVTDQGCGVTADQLKRLFDPFYSTKTHGLGMGLAISRSIIQSLGGRLSAKVNPKGGMTFSIMLPVAKGKAV